MRSINIISKSTTDSDKHWLFGPIEDSDEFFNMSEFKDMADIWVFVGLFKSRGQANKNNHGGGIPLGFTDIIKKKRNLRVTIWNCEEL